MEGIVVELSPAARDYLTRSAHHRECSREMHMDCGPLGVDGVPVWTCDRGLSEDACKAARVCSCGLDDLRRAIHG